MTIFITAPGWYRQPITVGDNATMADFARRAYDVTGLNIFSGFPLPGKNAPAATAVSSEGKLGAATGYNKTHSTNSNLSTVLHTAAVSALLSHNDELQFMNVKTGRE